MNVAAWSTGAFVVALLSVETGSRHLVSRDAFVMGTSIRLSTYTTDRQAGLTLLHRALLIVEETENELSTWRPQSAMSALNRAPVGLAWPLSPRLCGTFAVLSDWHRESEGAFDPAIGPLIEAWDIHGTGRVPSAEALRRAGARSGLDRFALDRSNCTVTRRVDVTIDVGAWGKGAALDRVAEQLAADSWMVDLGGQISVGGVMPTGEPWTVDLADPNNRHRAVAQVQLRSGSLSTSGGSERDLQVGRERVAHHLNPQTGRPVSFPGSVAVWHAKGLVADILSTALFVMGPDRGLKWAEARGVAAAYLVPMAGGAVDVLATSGFAPLLVSGRPSLR